MHRVPAMVALLLVAASDLAGQVLDDALVPAGLLRFEVSPVFTSWDSRFGRTAGGQEGRERLGADLTTSAAHTLFPGADDLRAAVEALTGTPGYSPALGQTQARVTKDVTRVDLGGHLGIFDWLTVGAVYPWTRTRTNLDVWFLADTVGGDLGLNPSATDSPGVSSFLQALGVAEANAQARAAQTCAGSPGSAGCLSAQALAERTSAFTSSAAMAYAASAFFPFATSSTAVALSQSVGALSADLVAAGLPGIAPPMPFATERVSEADFWELPTTSGSRVLAAPLGSLKGPWHAGDIELTATVRVLETGMADRVPTSPFSARVLATGMVRLPTGLTENPDTALSVGTGDGQMDLEGRLLGQLTIGRWFGLNVGGRYGNQRSRTLVRRVAPPETVLAPLSTRQLVEWRPGAYYGVEIAPVWRFTEELNLAGEYRLFRKFRDSFELAGASVGAPVDTRVLEAESGVTLHEVGGSLRYDTLGRLGEGVRPMQVHLRVLHAVAGGGGQTPVTTQVELGVRLFRRIWS